MLHQSQLRWVVASFVLWATAARADGEFPYDAFIAVEGAEVVSGPGHRYYATDRLARGTPVEVYQEEASGWLAIRPPDGSFSWTPAEFVDRSKEDDTVGRVRQPTPAWIGTAAEKVKQHRQLVTLKAGELVKILAEKEVETDAGQGASWLKIAPPAGEFRWVHLRDVSRQQPETLVEASNTTDPDFVIDEESLSAELADSRPRKVDAVASAIALRDIEPLHTQAREGSEIEPAQYRSTTGSSDSQGLSPDGFVPRKRKASSERLQSIPTPSREIARSQTPTLSRPKGDAPTLIADARPDLPPRPAPPVATTAQESEAVDQFANQLEQLDLELSLMVAQNRSTWNLAGLRSRVSELVERGEDPAFRGRARLLLDKIRRFEETFDVQGFGPVASGTEVLPGDSESPAAASAVAAGASVAAPRYDGQGWLKPVVSRQSDKPVAPFALVDAEGKPVVFVTPAPGMNLNRYLNRQVGIYGRRGYIAALKTSHVTVERVIDLDKQ